MSHITRYNEQQAVEYLKRTFGDYQSNPLFKQLREVADSSIFSIDLIVSDKIGDTGLIGFEHDINVVSREGKSRVIPLPYCPVVPVEVAYPMKEPALGTLYNTHMMMLSIGHTTDEISFILTESCSHFPEKISIIELAASFYHNPQKFPINFSPAKIRASNAARLRKMVEAISEPWPMDVS